MLDLSKGGAGIIFQCLPMQQQKRAQELHENFAQRHPAAASTQTVLRFCPVRAESESSGGVFPARAKAGHTSNCSDTAKVRISSERVAGELAGTAAPKPRQQSPRRAEHNRPSRPTSFPASFTPEAVGVSYLAPFDVSMVLTILSNVVTALSTPRISAPAMVLRTSTMSKGAG